MGLVDGWQRALWLLPTPFMLVNVAFWALPYASPGDSGVRRRVRRTAEAVQRLFALSITLAVLLGFVSVSMNFVGWVCATGLATAARPPHGSRLENRGKLSPPT